MAPLHGLLDPTTLLQTFGLLGVAAAVFAETGLLVGFFLPGDSLLFTACILAAAHKLPLILLCVVAFVAAVAGDSVGYAIGRRAGTGLYRRPDGRLVTKARLKKVRQFYELSGLPSICTTCSSETQTFLLAGIPRWQPAGSADGRWP